MFKQCLKAVKYPYWSEIRRGVSRGWYPAFITYKHLPSPRFGWGQPAEPILNHTIEQNAEIYRRHLRRFADLQRLGSVAKSDRLGIAPEWENPWFTGIDAAMLHYFIATERPKKFIEIGSGNSTKFARHAQKIHGTDTKIVSIDPYPRASIDSIADNVYRVGLQSTDLSMFDTLEKGDILFLDSSHRCFMGSDVTVFFMEVLPRIKSGVLIHIHDIHLPYDYPPHRNQHYESEQYLLAAQLHVAPDRFTIEMPCRYLLENESYKDLLLPIRKMAAGGDETPEGYIRGSSFWYRKRDH